MFAKITGTGAYLPAREVSNEELAKTLDTSDEWIFSHTGIRSRHVLAEDETTASMAAYAGQQALLAAGVRAESLGMIIVATSSPDYHTFPATACLVQHALGAVNAGAFDIQAACTGFVYALEVGRGMVMTSGRPVLVIGSDAMSRILNWEDRDSCILFGDGAGAMVLEPTDESPALWESILCADGKGADVITRGGGSRLIVQEPAPQYVKMNGRATFNFAVRKLDEMLRALAEKVTVPLEDLTWIFPHQANVRIIETVARRMNVPLEKFFMNIETVANTSSGSIPIALDQAVRSGKLKAGDCVAMVGFGAGLTYGGTIMRWPTLPSIANENVAKGENE